MKIINNKILPPRKFLAINLFGFIFTRDINKITNRTIIHESIHTMQMKETLYIFFYIWYGIEWIVRLIEYKDATLAYYNISFERESYSNEDNIEYLKTRKNFSWIKYIK